MLRDIFERKAYFETVGYQIQFETKNMIQYMITEYE